MSEMSLVSGLERRKEDYGLITGQARFVDALAPLGIDMPLKPEKVWAAIEDAHGSLSLKLRRANAS
jgi:hypothetical protein